MTSKKDSCIIKRYLLNIIKISQWSYLVIKQKLNENKIILYWEK